ncbi:MAG TPA: molecular chaperone TorD family protein [Gammaproteobacteria bacterium]
MKNDPDSARSRANVYRLLATVIRAPLTLRELRTLRDPAVLRGLAEAGVALDEAFLKGDEGPLLEALVLDFTQLFHGPRGHHPPYESVQASGDEGELNGDITQAVRRFYVSAGLLFDDEYRELPDHLSVELAFMAELAEREAAARKAGDIASAKRRVREQCAFLKKHLGRWATVFGQLVANNAESVFYREFARLLTEFIDAELLAFEQVKYADEYDDSLLEAV